MEKSVIDEFAQILHSFYRLSNTATSFRELLGGALKIFNQYLFFYTSTDVLKNADSHPFIKGMLKGHRNYTFKKGGVNILTASERRNMKTMKERYSPVSAMVPIVFADVTGMFFCTKSKKERSAITSDDRKKIKMFIEEMSLVARSFQLMEEQQRLLMGSIKAITKFLNYSIPTSSIHSDKMNRIIKELGKELKLSMRQVASLEYALMLHDAGKVDVPLDILKKVTPLTEGEYRIIKSHPKKGARLFRELHTLKPVMPIILYHHERYDGTGYPSGLKKKQIPLGARILSVLDAFDAMVFGRPYKEKIPLEKAMQELRAHRGVQFDPVVVDAFLKVLSKPSIRRYLKRSIP